jgi:parvulin-like peptidyl-prolyl isomerase
VTKKLLAVLVVLLMAATVGLVAGCGGNLPKDALAKVGNNIVTQKDFDQKVADLEAQYPGQIPDKTTDPDNYKLFEQYVLEYLITYQVASQAAPSLKVTVTDEEVQTQVDSILQNSFKGDQTKFDDALKQQGITMDELKSYYRETTLMQKVYADVTKGVTTIPDSDIQAYYDAHKSEYYTPETRTARHILLAPAAGRVDATTSTTSTSSTTSTTQGTGSATASSGDSTTTSDTSTATASSSTTTTAAPTQADWDSALQAAKLVRAQLIAGADWTTEAKTYSDDPGSSQTGGTLPTFGKDEMVKEFEDAAFSLKKDEISQPVKSIFGYHIIQVTAINEAKQYTLDEVKEDIQSSLLKEKQNETWQKWIDDQKAKVGVVYASGWETTTTTSSTTLTTVPATSGSSETTTTAAAGDTTTTAAASTTTTAAASTTTVAAPTSTTATAETSTTAGPTSTTASQ